MLLPAGQEYCWLTCSVLYRVVALFEVARGNWCLLEKWYLKPQDSWPKNKNTLHSAELNVVAVTENVNTFLLALYERT